MPRDEEGAKNQATKPPSPLPKLVVEAATSHGGPFASHTWMPLHPGSPGASFEAQLTLWRPLEAATHALGARNPEIPALVKKKMEKK